MFRRAFLRFDMFRFDTLLDTGMTDQMRRATLIGTLEIHDSGRAHRGAALVFPDIQQTFRSLL